MSEMFSACGHNAYWMGTYDTCMACRAEKAESRLQASEGEKEQLEKTVAFWAGKNNESRARIAELEKLCQEAAEYLDVYHNENHIVKSACNTCTLVTRLQSAQPGSEKEAR